MCVAIANIHEKKDKCRIKAKDEAIFEIQKSKDKQKMKVKENIIIKQIQITTTSNFVCWGQVL